MCISLVYANHKTYIVLCLIFCCTLAVLMFLGLSRPFIIRKDNNMRMINECFIILCLYYFLGFTNFVDSPNERNQIGYYLNATLSIAIMFNIAVVSIETIRYQVFQYKKRRYLKRKKLLQQKP